MSRSRVFVVLLGFVLAAAMVTMSISAAGANAAGKGTKAPKATGKATFTAKGSIGQVYVKDADAGVNLLLVNPDGRIADKGKADAFGSKIFRQLKPGKGWSVRQRVGGKVLGTSPFRVLKAGANPSQSFYDKQPALQEGLNYVKMRDGIELAMTVRLPPGKDLSDGPFPTVIEHSGYQTAAPHDLLNAILGGGDDPLAPSTSTVVGSLLGPQLGYASVSVQMRGSGCSGGAFDLFGLPTTYDGYDMIESVANEPWVKGGKVGMLGISFSGITQLFDAGTQPPHLSAIAPMSVTDDIYQATGYPGGIFNSGFALSWITERIDDAKPAPGGGQPWARELTSNGDPFTNPPNVPDQHCIDNQELRLQTLPALKLIEKNPFRSPWLFKERAPGDWLKNVKVPVFLTGQYQDEQTGPHFPESLNNLNGNKNVWVRMQNGVHTDSLGPMNMTKWVEFLDLFVANEVPDVPGLLTGGLFASFIGPSAPVEQSAYAGMSSVSEAKAAFRRDNPRFALAMDNGAGPWGTGAIGTTWQINSDKWPPKNVKPTNFFLDRGGNFDASAGAPGRASYVADPAARPIRNLMSGSVSAPQPAYDWAPIVDGKGIGYISGGLEKDTVIAGPSSLDLYLKSNKRDTDLQVTISEVRPDGNETYVQSGWLRASHRKLDPKRSTVLDPYPTHLKKDGAFLPKKGFTKIRVPIMPVVHAFRAGSKIRITISATGGDRSAWEFDTIDKGKTKNTIAVGERFPSKLVLPIMKGTTAQGTTLPDPTALRAQPSRVYAPATNGG